MPTYNKLILDTILQIIKSNGTALITRILSEDEYIKELSDLLELISVLARIRIHDTRRNQCKRKITPKYM